MSILLRACAEAQGRPGEILGRDDFFFEKPSLTGYDDVTRIGLTDTVAHSGQRCLEI